MPNKGHNGGYNPYRDAHGRFAGQASAGKGGTGAAGAKKEVQGIWTDNPPPKTSRLGKVNPWAYRPSPLPPKYRGKAKAPATPAPAKAKPPAVPKKYRDYSDMSSQADKLDRLHQEAQRKYDATQHRSRYPSAEAHATARKAAAAELDRVSHERSQVRKDRNAYLDGMAKYKSQSPYRYDD